MSSESPAAWLRTALGLLLAGLLLDHVAITTPVSAASDPGVTATPRHDHRFRDVTWWPEGALRLLGKE